MTKIINFFGGPGTGKSTSASGLFSWMKENNYSVELIQEFAKDLVYEQNYTLLQNQIYVFSEQFRRQYRLLDKVDYIITDSPLLLSSVYFEYYLKDNEFFTDEYKHKSIDYFDSSFRQFDNINFYIRRKTVFDVNGRNIDEENSKNIDNIIYNKLINNLNNGILLETDSMNAKIDSINYIQQL